MEETESDTEMWFVNLAKKFGNMCRRYYGLTGDKAESVLDVVH